ncbi:DUF5818 domain-containing protein [Sphingomonas sp.]|jgi:hypothetical protein|uniref:DUF5818 domain-containing protein n=1 Tax=Sphingomonas sp. TaxID=28214 RepID=UPI00261F6C0B|nr:DUF5818 domain-containing protein [Sphingomonas sp.]MDF2496209.1 hypothetical protein [Sphingomonas sp.]
MPIGTRHDETGWLNEQAGERLLRRDGGGTWRLEMGLRAYWRSRRLLGQRVQVVGKRIDFDVLAVEQLRGIGNAR